MTTHSGGVLFLPSDSGIRTHLNADAQWASAATSSKTGGFLFDNRIPHPGTMTTHSGGFFIHSLNFPA
jgi:hypothetical protein